MVLIFSLYFNNINLDVTFVVDEVRDLYKL